MRLRLSQPSLAGSWVGAELGNTVLNTFCSIILGCSVKWLLQIPILCKFEGLDRFCQNKIKDV